MVSNARLDLPDPERPVTTTSLSRGISTEMFFRLWTRAPWTAIVVRAAPRAGLAIGLELIGNFSHVNEGELLHLNVADFGQPGWCGSLADEAASREVLACDDGT